MQPVTADVSSPVVRTVARQIHLVVSLLDFGLRSCLFDAQNLCRVSVEVLECFVV
jgi:2-keto-3-deoxy-L-rhamnonate aldolase RhmA